MSNTTPQNKGRPQGVLLPRDIVDFLKAISDCYGNHDINQLISHLSHDFLHQGMDRIAFRERLKQSALLGYLKHMEITLLHFRREANIAEISGFAETNLGVFIPAGEGILPIIEDSKLILESGEWKLHGNQSKSAQGLFRSLHQLSACFTPKDRTLYRSVLPSCFQMPSEPMVLVKVTDNMHVRSPYKPYRLVSVQILAEFEEVQGWYTLTMPETEWIPVEAGKTIGYPKYVVDFIGFEEVDGAWVAEMVGEGDNAVSLSLQFDEDYTQTSLFEKMTRRPPMIFLRKIMPRFREKPWFLLMPSETKDLHGHVMIFKGEPLISGLPDIQETFGKVKISLKTDQSWGGLFPSTVSTKGIFMQFSGELNLGHRLITMLEETSNSA